MSYLSEQIRYVDWCNGSAKRTSWDGFVFLTRKDRRIYSSSIPATTG